MDRELDRRDVLALSGALAAAALAGCTAQSDPLAADPDDTDGQTPTPSDDTPTGEPDAADRLGTLVEDNAEFALDLHRQVADGNTFLSPYSVSVALAMTYAGAEGDTEQAMEETLRYTLGADVHPAFADLEAALERRETAADPRDGDEIDAVRLRVANALWAADDYPLADSFVTTLDEHYGAGVRRADFATDPDGERARINDWVAEQTEGTIEQLLPPDSITTNTVMVLANAIYFLAGWALEFDPANTTEETFTALDGSESSVPMMHRELRTTYTTWNGHQALELPYVGEEVSMVLLLPAEGSFESFESSLTADRLFGVFDALEDATGSVAVPRFQYRTAAPLRSALSTMGMPGAFESEANFSGMVEDGDGPFIDQVYHKTYVSVDEEGTEASGATAVVMKESAARRSFDVTLDRPFLFCVRDRPTDAVLFLGRVTDAGAAQP